MMTVQEIKEVLDKRPDIVDFLNLVLKDPDLIHRTPELTKLIQEGEGKGCRE